MEGSELNGKTVTSTKLQQTNTRAQTESHFQLGREKKRPSRAREASHQPMGNQATIKRTSQGWWERKRKEERETEKARGKRNEQRERARE